MTRVQSHDRLAGSRRRIGKRSRLTTLASFSAAVSAIASPRFAHATDGTWGVNAVGSWGASANWVNGNIASGIGAAAHFDAVNLTDGYYYPITLGADWTVGSLYFSDTGASSNYSSYRLIGNTLTLQTSSGVPTISVTTPANGVSQFHEIDSTVAGTQGFNKIGNTYLELAGNNTYTGTTSILNGGIVIDSNNALGLDASAINLADSTAGNTNFAVLSIFTAGVTLNRPVAVQAGGTGVAYLQYGVGSGVGTYSGVVTLNKGLTVGSAGGTESLTNKLTGTGQLTVGNFGTSSVGTVSLSGANDYSGGTLVGAGTLVCAATNTLPSTGVMQLGAAGGTTGSLSLGGFNQSIAALQFVAPSSSYKTTLYIGGSKLTVNGNITLVNNTGLPGNAYGTVVNSTTGGSLDLGGAVRTLTVAGQNLAQSTAAGELALNVPIVNGGLIYTGIPSTYNSAPTNVIFGGLNTFTGGLTINEGTITLTPTATIGGATQAITINASGAATAGSALVLNSSQTIGGLAGTVTTPAGATISLATSTTLTDNQANDTSYAGTIIGAGGLTKDGAGNLTLSAANSYTGATLISNGGIVVAANNALGTVAAGTTVAAGASLGIKGGINYSTAEPLTINGAGVSSQGALINVSGTNGFAGPVTLGSASSIGVLAGQLTLTNSIMGNFAIGKVGPGTLVTNAVNNYGGATAIAAGAWKLGIANSLPTGTAVSFGSGTTQGVLNLNGFNQTVASINEGLSSASNIIQNSSSTAAVLTISGSAASTFGGSIGSGGTNLSLAKTGASIMTLSGSETYAGTTTVSSGSLYVNGTHTGGAGYTFTSTLGGNGSIGSTVSADTSSGTLAPGPDANTIGNLTVAAFTLNSHSTLQIKLNAPTAATATADRVTTTAGGIMYLDGAALSLVGLNTTGLANDHSNTFEIVNNTDPGATTHGQLAFNGLLLADGAAVNAAGTTFHIYYSAGDGNDVVLTDEAPEPAALVGLAACFGALRRNRRRPATVR